MEPTKKDSQHYYSIKRTQEEYGDHDDDDMIMTMARADDNNNDDSSSSSNVATMTNMQGQLRYGNVATMAKRHSDFDALIDQVCHPPPPPPPYFGGGRLSDGAVTGPPFFPTATNPFYYSSAPFLQAASEEEKIHRGRLSNKSDMVLMNESLAYARGNPPQQQAPLAIELAKKKVGITAKKSGPANEATNKTATTKKKKCHSKASKRQSSDLVRPRIIMDTRPPSEPQQGRVEDGTKKQKSTHQQHEQSGVILSVDGNTHLGRHIDDAGRRRNNDDTTATSLQVASNKKDDKIAESLSPPLFSRKRSKSGSRRRTSPSLRPGASPPPPSHHGTGSYQEEEHHGDDGHYPQHCHGHHQEQLQQGSTSVTRKLYPQHHHPTLDDGRLVFSSPFFGGTTGSVMRGGQNYQQPQAEHLRLLAGAARTGGRTAGAAGPPLSTIMLPPPTQHKQEEQHHQQQQSRMNPLNLAADGNPFFMMSASSAQQYQMPRGLHGGSGTSLSLPSWPNPAFDGGGHGAGIIFSPAASVAATSLLQQQSGGSPSLSVPSIMSVDNSLRSSGIERRQQQKGLESVRGSSLTTVQGSASSETWEQEAITTGNSTTSGNTRGKEGRRAAKKDEGGTQKDYDRSDNDGGQIRGDDDDDENDVAIEDHEEDDGDDDESDHDDDEASGEYSDVSSSTGPPKRQKKTIGEERILRLEKFDVVCGRGFKLCRTHPGNVEFRTIVEQSRQQYRMALSRDEKSSIVRRIMDTVRSKRPGGRFVKRVKLMHHAGSEGAAKDNDNPVIVSNKNIKVSNPTKADNTKRKTQWCWVEVSNKAAREKVGHAIRNDPNDPEAPINKKRKKESSLDAKREVMRVHQILYERQQRIFQEYINNSNNNQDWSPSPCHQPPKK